jgi:hypothetical protein
MAGTVPASSPAYIAYDEVTCPSPSSNPVIVDLAPELTPTSPVIDEVGISSIDVADRTAKREDVLRFTPA